MEQQLAATVQSHLQLGLYENATFLCERLVAASPTEAHKYLLAQCYKHAGQEHRAIHLLDGYRSEHCRYLVALCCLNLKRYQDAEAALTREGPNKVPCGAAGCYLLGLVHQRTCREEGAAQHYAAALQQDPLMWSAYVALCGLGKEAAATAASAAHWVQLPAAAAAAAGAPAAPQQQQQQQQQGWGRPAGIAGHSSGREWSEAQALSAMSINTSNVTPTPVASWALPTPAAAGAAAPGPPAMPSTSTAAAGHGRPYQQQHLVPQALTFATPSPGPEAAPHMPPVPVKAAGAAPPAAGFPGFTTPSTAAAATAAGMRTPMLGKQKGGAAGSGADGEAARRNKVSKAAGRLFAEGGGGGGGGTPGATPRRSARLAAHQQQQEPGSGSTPAAGGRASTLPFSQDAEQQLPMDLDEDLTSPRPPAAPAAAAAAAVAGAPAKAGGWQNRQQQQQRSSEAGGASLPNGDSRAQELEQQQQQQQGDPGGAEAASAAAAATAAAAAAAATAQLAALFKPLQAAVLHASQHRAAQALAALQQLDRRQWNTAQVQVLRGRVLYEGMQYKEAAAAFESARKLDPTCLEGMEIYSSVLWHLHREVELAHLTEEVLAMDRLSPAAWCVAGNCFSLQREHEAATRCLQRALQLAPHHAYAATLLGHEHLALEDLGAGLVAFQAALRAEPRHYAALYGIGQIYLRQEKYADALHHFQLALRLKPQGSILHHCCGTALARLGRAQEALAAYSAAVTADPKNGVARFDRAQQLLEEGRVQEALTDALALQEMAPREYLVHMLLGRLYRRLGAGERALAAFSAALDLGPSGSDKAAIKAAMDRLNASDDEEEEEM